MFQLPKPKQPSEDVLLVENISKRFRIPHEKKTKLFEYVAGAVKGNRDRDMLKVVASEEKKPQINADECRFNTLPMDNAMNIELYLRGLKTFPHAPLKMFYKNQPGRKRKSLIFSMDIFNATNLRSSAV